MNKRMALAAALALALTGLCGCAVESGLGSSVAHYSGSVAPPAAQPSEPSSASSEAASSSASASASASSASASASSASAEDTKAYAKQIFKKLGVIEDYRDAFVHGKKGAKYQKYIVLHDTEGGGTPEGVISSWDNAEAGIAAHFVVGRDGSIAQCVKLDNIAHHAGFGDTGHNKEYGVEDESRDDKVGTEPIGDWASDYGMNSYSIGIEMVHIGGEEDYPEIQLEAVDAVIAYIDAYYGDNAKKSTIIDHKAWRSGNSDTSDEFAPYFENYQGKNRTHNGKAWDISALKGWKDRVAEAGTSGSDEDAADVAPEDDAGEGIVEDPAYEEDATFVDEYEEEEY